MRPFRLFSSVIAGAGVVALVATSCAHGGFGMLSFPDGTPPPQGRSWVLCQTTETTDAVVATIIGGQPAVLTLPRGHQLRVPSTALAANDSLVVTFRQLPGPGVAVELLPSDSTFRDDLTLSLVYDGRGCDVPTPVTQMDIYRVQGNGPHQRLRKPVATPPAGRVVGLLDHFTEFAIAR